MSLFRKPKKPIQRRVFTADDDDDETEANGEPQAPPPPIISRQKKEKPVKTTSLLSFADEEEEGEVFKVKKSKQSSRLAKKREKDKKKAPDEPGSKNNVGNDNGEPMDIDQPVKQKKKVTLEGLILSGREALAADGTGDISEEEASGNEEEDNRGFHQYRAESVRAALAVGGHIPDAALIHAARKTRQQARELGGDYIPVKPSEAKPGSRLVRDDGSGDEDEDGRIEVRGLELPSDKPERGTAVGPANEELDSEPDEWEEQQIKKAMPAIPDIAGENAELNPFAMQLPAASLQQQQPAHLRPLALPSHQAPATPAELVQALTTRLAELHKDRSATLARRQTASDRLVCAGRVRERAAARCGALDAAYRRAQAARGYITDLIECLDEKMPALEALEARALALHRRRCEYLTERRRADVRDQAHQVMSHTARPGAAKPVETEDKIRRAAEREGRRRARRLAREAAGGGGRHREGDSSDDELPPAEKLHINTERESIRVGARAVWGDALPAWGSAAGVCGRVARWRRSDPALYTDAYVADCLPRLLAPYVRHQLILWNPLADEDNEDYERMEWYKCLAMYGVSKPPRGSDSEESDDEEPPPKVTEESVREDPDLMLVPTIVAKVVLPKITELVEASWDPMCVRACIRLRGLVVRASEVPGARAALARLQAAALARLRAANVHDVFLPALPPQLMEGAGGGFWRRCLGAGVRLLRAALALTAPPPVLCADHIVIALVETLCCAAGAAPATNMSAAATALAETLPRAGALRVRCLARIARLAALALSRLQSDNPMHLKALEQARTIIAEAKTAE